MNTLILLFIGTVTWGFSFEAGAAAKEEKWSYFWVWVFLSFIGFVAFYGFARMI
jgi:heme/copper-type cytochrome/quinol oxidase subunit 2